MVDGFDFNGCFFILLLTQKKNGGEKKNGDGEEKKKEDNPITVVLKIDVHCEGCASKIKKFVNGLEGIYRPICKIFLCIFSDIFPCFWVESSVLRFFFFFFFLSLAVRI